MWFAAEQRTAAILARLRRESKQFRGDRILQPSEFIAERCSCGLVRGERWVSGTKIETHVDERSAEFQKNSRLMVDRLRQRLVVRRHAAHGIGDPAVDEL